MIFQLVLFGLAVFFLWQYSKKASLPPGPAPWHILGNIPHIVYNVMLTSNLVKAMEMFKKKHGDIFTLWLGPIPTVHIASMELAHEVMVKQGNNLADRWIPYIFRYLREEHGIIGSNGDYWVEQRRFTLQTLRNFGVGRNLVEERVMLEFDAKLSELGEHLKKDNNYNVGAKQFVDLMVGNIINRMLLSVRFTEKNQEEFFRIKNAVDFTTESFSLLDIIAGEWIHKIPFINIRYKKLFTPMDDLVEILQKQVEDRKEAIRTGQHVIVDEGTDYVDAYLKKIEDEKENPQSTFNEDSLIVNLFDLWIAGQETITTTILWAFVHFLQNPEVVEKIRKEVHEVTQQSRTLSLKDKSDTPYLNATINEVHRHATILSINLFRQVKETTNIAGYTIKRGIPITAEISLIMNDEKYFDNINKFDPERFLKTEKLEQNIVPFGMGKRACLGESLARSELYLILGNLIAKYDLQAVGKVPSVVPTNSSGLFKRPESFKIRVIPLNND